MKLKLFKKKPFKLESVQDQQLKRIEEDSYIRMAIELAKERGKNKAIEDYEKNRR